MSAAPHTARGEPLAAAAGTAALALSGLRVSFDRNGPPALDLAELIVPAGQRLAVIGGSGAGKTTLLRAINGLVRPEVGEIRVLGETMAAGTLGRRAFRRRIGLVFQEFNLIERASVFHNVLAGRLGWMNPLASLAGIHSETDKALAIAAITDTGLGPFARRRADSLSGGQRQRVAIARVLAQAPDLICADEPVSNLDPALTADMIRLLAAACRARAATLVMVVHHPALARSIADRIIGLNAGRKVFDSAHGAMLDAAALHTIYGRDDIAWTQDGARRNERDDRDGRARHELA